MTEKEFTLKYLFQNVGKLEDEQELDSPEEEHFGVKWSINMQKHNKDLSIYLYANVTENQKISVDYIGEIVLINMQKRHLMSASSCVFKYNREFRCCYSIPGWEIWENELYDDGILQVEIHVRITKMLGFPKLRIGFPRKELRSFGEEMQQFSDVILKIEERKFHVSKLYLSSHSPYFATLFLGRFQESEKSEIELRDVDSQDFQCYLEVLYGENGIESDTVEGILSVADMYDTPLTVKKCEEFLVRESKMELKKKLELAGNYRLEELKLFLRIQVKWTPKFLPAYSRKH
ncbi:hypothetical protein B9Z55_007470 [Caenorhabditis nigoni]|uniref:BTB domain-containing protein n=1 Tax=Caenorhabditis nigoni TaxID=1611254 RepID=A0A2G5V9R6_9PELO|nr:hypothetical protein B9Z55_007470 [Caenorhabditis nigoni]